MESFSLDYRWLETNLQPYRNAEVIIPYSYTRTEKKGIENKIVVRHNKWYQICKPNSIQAEM